MFLWKNKIDGIKYNVPRSIMILSLLCIFRCALSGRPGKPDDNFKKKEKNPNIKHVKNWSSADKHGLSADAYGVLASNYILT